MQRASSGDKTIRR